jgi:hypothetical protein
MATGKTSQGIPTPVLLNPLLHPQVSFTAIYPNDDAVPLSASSRAEAVEAFRTVIAQAAGLEDASWVKAAAAGNASMVAITATVRVNDVPQQFHEARLIIVEGTVSKFHLCYFR